MASTLWSTWVTWEGSVEQTLAKGQLLASGDVTVAEARARALASGERGMLGITTLDDRPHLGRCWVLAGPELHQHFGSKTPPKRGVEAGREAFVRKLERGQAVAITAFLRGGPSAVLFAGRTDG